MELSFSPPAYRSMTGQVSLKDRDSGGEAGSGTKRDEEVGSAHCTRFSGPLDDACGGN